MEEWDRRVCATATVNDLDLIALRDALQRMGVFDPERGLDDYLSDAKALSPFVPPLCVRESLTGTLRPRNFAMLLFGRNLQAHVPGAYTLFSVYPGVDRSEPHAERHELAGSLIEQATRLLGLLDAHSYVVFDKTNRDSPNAMKYPRPALHEAMVNALAHRDYEITEPSRITVFSNRIEILSPGSLPTGVSLDELRQGRAAAKWRNQTLAWFLNRLQLAQAEGQGIPTILRAMKDEGCPPPQFDANETRVVCVLPAHPRHALALEHRATESVSPSPLKLFLSYAHEDEQYVNELRKDLKLMERNGLIQVWSERALSAGERWEESVLKELEAVDVIICQLSRDFLASDFYLLNELDTAIQRKLAGEEELIAYVLRECRWQQVPELKHFRILPPGAKPLSKWKKDDYWRAVADGIQQASEELQSRRSTSSRSFTKT